MPNRIVQGGGENFSGGKKPLMVTGLVHGVWHTV